MLFDFVPYLQSLDSSQTYAVHQLTGGLINVTVRAVKSSAAIIDEGRFPGNQTLVLKYAPPFIAAAGKDAPFPQFRQTVEARALKLFTPPDGILKDIYGESSVLVPHLLHHDETSQILIMSDLGNMTIVTEYLKFIASEPSLNVFSVKEMGSRLGHFLAKIHSPKSIALIGSKGIEELYNPDIENVVFDAAVQTIEGHLRKFKIPGAAQLYHRVKQDFLREDAANERCFASGDLWTGGILVGKSGGSDAIGVIDWEFAGPGRGVNGDMAQLFAHLHLHRLAAIANPVLAAITQTFLEAIGSAYRHWSTLEGAHWTIQAPSDSAYTPSTASTPSLFAAQMMRSTFILHGREMINNALDLDWQCTCCKVVVKDTCSLVRRMVEKGLWYLERAGGDVDEFVQEENWALVRAEEYQVLGRLFYDV